MFYAIGDLICHRICDIIPGVKKNQNSLSVKRGLNLLRLGWFFHNFMLVVPVIVLVYAQRGISVGDFFLIQGIFRLAAFLFEIPSGYMSDRFSRRRVMILGALFSTLGFAIVASAYGFWAIVAGEALLGISSALFSGTLEAYTYDLLKRNNSQKQFLKQFGNIMTFASVATFISSILGGMVFVAIGGTGLLWIEALFSSVSIVAFLFLPELLEVKRTVKNKTAIADAVGISYKTLQNSRLRNLILFPSMFGGFTIVMLWIMQPIMETARVPVELFGLFFGINQFAGIIFSKFAYKICEKLGEIRVSVITILVIIVGALMGLVATHTSNMILVYGACAIMATVPAIRLLNNLQYNTLIHHSIRSTERGTVLSTRAMVSALCGAGMLTVAKFLMDGCGIGATLIFLLGMSGVLFWILGKVKKIIKVV